MKLTARVQYSWAQYYPTAPGSAEINKRVEELAKKKGVKMSEIALAWAGLKVTSPIVGVSSPERLDEAIIKGITLTDEEVKYLEEPYKPVKIAGHF